MNGHLWRLGRAAIQIVILSALILAPRCANYRQVFVDGNVYFTDADCYARMTRVRMCLAHPGLVLRHHDFENFPQGTTPHTTVPLDYLILALAGVLAPFTAHALDLAGAIVSPVLALAGACFLWWWMRKMKFRHGWPMLIVFAFSPILVHGTELGRPDHQSLLIVLLMTALCAEWTFLRDPSRGWSVVAGCSWALALWVSLYEPLVLFGLVLIASLLLPGAAALRFSSKSSRAGWLCFFALIILALLIERRIPSVVGFANDPLVRHWARNIGELQPVPFFNAAWFRWAGCLLAVIPLLVWWQGQYFREPVRQRQLVLFLILLGATFALTMWQARWSYFLVSVFAIALPTLLEPWRSRWIVWTVFVLSLWPMAREWDEQLWPNDTEMMRRQEARLENVNLRDLALTMTSSERLSFLAPWWLSPSLAYWSGQPAVAGSSHESMAGIAETARFFGTADVAKAREIEAGRQVTFVVACDADRTAESCREILGESTPEHALCYVLDRAPATSPAFLVLAAQNQTGKLFRIAHNL